MAIVLKFDFLFLIKCPFSIFYTYCQESLAHHQETIKGYQKRCPSLSGEHPVYDEFTVIAQCKDKKKEGRKKIRKREERRVRKKRRKRREEFHIEEL